VAGLTRYVLEGSARKPENRVRINAQSIDASSGHHLWADRYDGNMKDIFTLQDNISILLPFRNIFLMIFN
jgi:adenylate cyclase